MKATGASDGLTPMTNGFNGSTDDDDDDGRVEVNNNDVKLVVNGGGYQAAKTVDQTSHQ
jgi:hypothetical protein